MPYEELNAPGVSFLALERRDLSYQPPNPQKPFRSLATYIKGTFQTKPRPEVYNAIFEKVVKITAERPKMQCVVGLEFTSLQKACRVPKDATAFNRSPYPRILSMLRWDDNQPDDLEFARSSIHDLTRIIMEGNVDLPQAERGASGYAYSNYGELHI